MTSGSPGEPTVVYAEILETTKGGAEESSIKEAPKALRNQGPEERAQTFTQRTSLHPALHRIPFRATGATGEPLTLLVCYVSGRCSRNSDAGLRPPPR